MKLTNSMREAFVRSAMNDVPTIDYSEKIRSAAMKLAIAGLPPKVRAIYQDEALRGFVASYYRNVAGVHMNLPGADRESSTPISAQLKPLEVEADAQHAKLETLRRHLKSVAQSAGTRAALAKMLPEFEKYLPADEATALRTVPALANVVADFVKAGWPKGGKKVAKALV